MIFFLQPVVIAFKWFTLFMSSIVGHSDWNRYYVYERILVNHRYLNYAKYRIHKLLQIALMWMRLNRPHFLRQLLLAWTP